MIQIRVQPRIRIRITLYGASFSRNVIFVAAASTGTGGNGGGVELLSIPFVSLSSSNSCSSNASRPHNECTMSGCEAARDTKYAANAVVVAEVRPSLKCGRRSSPILSGNCHSLNVSVASCTLASERIALSMRSSNTAAVYVAEHGLDRNSAFARHAPKHVRSSLNVT